MFLYLVLPVLVRSLRVSQLGVLVVVSAAWGRGLQSALGRQRQRTALRGLCRSQHICFEYLHWYSGLASYYRRRCKYHGTMHHLLLTCLQIRNSPVVADGIVFIGSSDLMYGFNALNGNLVWSHHCNGLVDFFFVFL